MPEQLPADLVDLRDRLRVFVEDELRPLERELGDDADTQIPEAPIPEALRRQVIERSRAAGFFGMTQPRSVGGSEAEPLALVVARETLAAANTPFARLVFGPGPGILHAAAGILRERYLEPVLRGERSGAWAFTEPSGAERATWARREGDDLLVTGRKAYVSGGETADFYSVLVNVEADDAGPGGTAIVVIDHDTPGVAIERAFHSMEGGNHVELSMDGARVPQAHLVGAIGEGMPRALGNISEERLELAATASGIALWAVEHVTEHITAPHRSGTPLGAREGVRLHYAQMRLETYAARSTLYRTARLVEHNEGPPEAVVNETMAAKVFCTETAGRVIDTAVQLVGGQALIRGHPLERLYRRVRSMRLAGGASDVLRLNIARGRLEFDAGRL